MASRLHVGIYCDYGFTLTPNAGIGVFVSNLIDGLVSMPDAPTITLVANPSDRHVLTDAARRWGPRVRMLPALNQYHLDAKQLRRAERALHRRIDALQERITSACYGTARRCKECVRALLGLARDAVATRGHQRVIKALLAAGGLLLVVPLFGSAAWPAVLLGRLLTGFLLPALLYPPRLAARFLGAWAATDTREFRLRAANCDVWLLPYSSLEIPLPGPTIAVVFDLVYRHVPGIYNDELRRLVETCMRARAQEARLVYCGSKAVKEQDIVPVLQVPLERVRVFPLAPPTDRPNETDLLSANALAAKYGIGKRYLFYPAGLRPHKNHIALIRALRRLHDAGDTGLELVCTGMPDRQPELHAIIQREGLTSRVHFLGVVPRADVWSLYRHALLVPLPSLHEGYGLPVLEALQSGCPIACADIAAFRELLDGAHAAVLFFDPLDPATLAEAVRRTLARREHYRARQREAYRKIARRDWAAVAADFLALFREAASSPASEGQRHAA